MQTQTNNPAPKEVVFDESGQTVEVIHEQDPVADEAREAAVSEEVEETPAPAAKYRIGDQEFATQEEALAYAQRQVEIDNAYQQGVREAAANIQTQHTNVTPGPAAPVVEENVDELYTNPQEFLKRYATKIKTETMSDINQRDNLRAQSEQIWREFTDRHPSLADFRGEVENFVNTNNGEVRAIIQTKGRPASYDFIATKLKSRFEAYANSLKPKRELPNTGGGPSPTSKAGNVTPKEAPKKVLSMSEQIRSIKRNR